MSLRSGGHLIIFFVSTYGYNSSMSIYKKLVFQYRVARAHYRRNVRRLFPSPAEVEFVRIFGGKYIVFSRIKNPRTGFPLTIITSLGSILKRELVKHEVRVGRYWVDFSSVTKYYKKAIECDGKNWHQDIIHEQERDEYIGRFGFEMLHIQAASIYREPQLVQRKVLEFLAR